MRAVRSGTPGAAGGRGRPLKVQKAPTAWPPKSVGAWNDEWGNLIGAQAYVVSAADAKSALDQTVKFSAYYSSLTAEESLTGEGPGEEQGLTPELSQWLLSFFADYGPLGFVGPLGNRLPGRKGERRIDLLEMAEELKLIGDAWAWVFKRLGSVSEENRRADELVGYSKYALTESYLEPFVDKNDTVQIKVGAASLRALLWVTVLDKNGFLRGICRQCPTPLKRRTGRGRPYEYCEQHRTWAAQKRRQRSNFEGVSM